MRRPDRFDLPLRFTTKACSSKLSATNGLANRPNDPQAIDFVVEAPGIEADSGHSEITFEHQSGTISTDADPAPVSDRAPKYAVVPGVVTESSEVYELSNVVETARALVLAAEAKRWVVVMQIADELYGSGNTKVASMKLYSVYASRRQVPAQVRSF
jgi:hypothetical protein